MALQKSWPLEESMRQKGDNSLDERERHIFHYSMVVLLVSLDFEDLKYPNTLFTNKNRKNLKLLSFSWRERQGETSRIS